MLELKTEETAGVRIDFWSYVYSVRCCDVDSSSPLRSAPHCREGRLNSSRVPATMSVVFRTRNSGGSVATSFSHQMPLSLVGFVGERLEEVLRRKHRHVGRRRRGWRRIVVVLDHRRNGRRHAVVHDRRQRHNPRSRYARRLWWRRRRRRWLLVECSILCNRDNT